MELTTAGRPLKIVRIGGYLVAGGALAGFSIGIYSLFNRALFSFLVRIYQLEAMSYFLTVFMPSFVILIIIGYLFATTTRLKSADLPNIALLSVLGILCIVLSSLSFFYIVSFIGGFLILMALIKAYTKPSFRTLSKREAFFLEEIGLMLVFSFSALFLMTWTISNFYQTYAMGFYGSHSPYTFLLPAVLSFLMFFAIPLLGSQGTNTGLCGAFGLAVSIVSFLIIMQSRYVFLDAPSYIGVFLLVAGFVSVLVGGLAYVRLFFSKLAVSSADTLPSSILYQGKFCPYCGKPRLTVFQTWCSHCRRNLMWSPSAPYCPSCGRVVPTNAKKCPHCQEEIEEKRIRFEQKDAKEQAIANKLIAESKKKS